jgi:hypothetical protein
MRTGIQHNSTDFDTLSTLSPAQIQVAIAIAKGANFTVAARQVGVNRASVYDWIRCKPVFKAAILEAFRRLDQHNE